MRISIVTISFNQAKYIEQTITSVLEQNYPDIEYIIVDAGSTDGSRDIIRKFGKRIAHAIFEPDKGPSDGLNKGFARASGDIFGFVNADDILLPGSVSAVTDAFASHPQADVVHGHGYIIDADGRLVRRIYADPYDLRRLAYGCVTFIQPSVFFRKAAFQRVGGFNTENKTCWDGELMYDFGIHGCSFQQLPRFLSSFRLHAAGSSGMGTANPKYAQWLKDEERMFRKARGREEMWYDQIGKASAHLQKWLRNPKGLAYNIGRILFGLR